MEFIGGCMLFGVGFAILCKVAASIFLDAKEKRDDRNLRNY